MILLATSLGVFIAQFDSQVINLALKHIGSDLGSSVSELQWVMDAYNLFYATLLLTGGTLGDIHGRMRIFVTGIALIAVGSVLCMAAPNGMVLIAGRALTGIGAALDVSTSLAIVSVTYRDPAQRARAIGIWASCNGIATAAGPTIGGLVVDAAGWRTVCVLVLPICALIIMLAIRSVPETRDPQNRQLDPAGQFFAIAALAALCIAAIEAPHRGWTSTTSLLSITAFVAATVAFLAVEKGKKDALTPLDIFRNAEFNATLAAAGCMTFGMYAMLFLLPLYLQNQGGLSAFSVGLVMLPMSLTFIVISQASGRLAGRFGARVLMTAGLASMGSGLLALVFVSASPSLLLIEFALLVIGVGLGLNTAPVNAVAVASVPSGRAGTASGLVNTARMIGATLGIAALGALYAIFAAKGTTPAITTGLRLAFLGGGAVELVGALIAARFIRTDSMLQSR
jgi:EmrB/QacA subfamily drug resistance transporter